jgi:hypothetical protein
MFGVLNEALLNTLESAYLKLNEGHFKKQFNKYVRTILENKTIKEFYNIYGQFKNIKFDNELIATHFLDESLKYLNQFDKNEIKLLTTLIEGDVDVEVDDYIDSLDQLIFNENLNVYDRAEHKVKLIKHLTTNKEKQNSEDNFNSLHKKVNNKIDTLNTNQKKVVELFIENDNQKIKDFYLNLIEETRALIDNKTIETDDVNVIKKLTEVNVRLRELKNEPPLIEEIEKIIELKESL